MYYPCSQAILDKVQYLSFTSKDWDAVNINQAVSDALLYNSREPDSTRRRLIERIKTVMTGPQKYDWQPTLTIKMFYDLDRVFFGGWLIGNAFVEWSDDKDFMLPTKYGRCFPASHSGKCYILLSAYTLLSDPMEGPTKQCWSTLLHEMCQKVFPYYFTHPSSGLGSLGNDSSYHPAPISWSRRSRRSAIRSSTITTHISGKLYMLCTGNPWRGLGTVSSTMATHINLIIS